MPDDPRDILRVVGVECPGVEAAWNQYGNYPEEYREKMNHGEREMAQPWVAAILALARGWAAEKAEVARLNGTLRIAWNLSIGVAGCGEEDAAFLRWLTEMTVIYEDEAADLAARYEDRHG